MESITAAGSRSGFGVGVGAGVGAGVGVGVGLGFGVGVGVGVGAGVVGDVSEPESTGFFAIAKPALEIIIVTKKPITMLVLICCFMPPRSELGPKT